MRTRLMAPALLALAGCYFTPNDQKIEGDVDGLTSTGDNPRYGAVGEGRGKIEEGPFTVYWQWYDTWETGTCVELIVRNGEKPLKWWDLRLRTDQELTQWTYEDGAFFWPEGDEIYIEPVSSGSFSARATKSLYYCAEPLHEITRIEVNYEHSGHSNGDDGDDGGDGSDGSSDGGDGSTDGDDGGTDGDDGTDVTRATRGELFPGPFTLRWYQFDEWEQGNCTHVTLINGDQDLESWELTLQGNTTFRVTSEWGAWLVPSADSMRVLPNETDGLLAGESFTFGYCTEPHTAITDASAVFEVRAPSRD